MYAIKYRLKYRSKRKFIDKCTVYMYDDEDYNTSVYNFNYDVKTIRVLFSEFVDDRYFYARVELIKSSLTPSQLSFTDDYDVKEVFGTYMEKGILKIGYLGG